MSDAASVSLKIETGNVLDLSMEEVLYDQFHSRTLLESQILQLKHYKQEDLVLQHISIKEEFTLDVEDKWGKMVEVNDLGKGCIIDTLTSDDIQELVKTGGKVVEISEDVKYRMISREKPVRTSPMKGLICV